MCGSPLWWIDATAPRNRLVLHLPHADPFGVALTATGATAAGASLALIVASSASAPSQLPLSLLYAGVLALVSAPALLMPGVVLLVRTPSSPWIERVDPPRDALSDAMIVRGFSTSLSF